MRHITFIIGVCFFVLISGVHPQALHAAQDEQPANMINTPAGGFITEPLPQIKGPKRAVAVGKFDAVGAFTAKYGDWDIGGGLSAMLVTALQESDRFIVMERANISQVLAEQEMKASGITNQSTGPKLKQLSGVQYLIYGSVTEFDHATEGGGLSLGFGSGLWSSALSRQSKTGVVAIDLRIVDTTTSQIIKTITVREELEQSGFDASVGYQGISLGGNKFWSTPLGGAARKAIGSAVTSIVIETRDKPWIGRVVDVDGKEVVINAGSVSGVKQGDQFMIKRITKVFTDPDTGEVLGSREEEIGLIHLVNVSEKLSFASFFPMGDYFPERGDLVVYASE